MGEDVDLMVLLTALTPSRKTIYFLKPGKGKTERKIYSSASCDNHEEWKHNILFLHAFSGCDSTSAFFGKGKITFCKLMERRTYLAQIAAIFNDPSASQDAVAEAGERFILALYGAPKDATSINNHRYLLYLRSLQKNKVSNLAKLPPTAAAAREHSFRVYQQVQEWRGNEMPAEGLGWKLDNGRLVPIRTSLPPAPDSVLKMISCNCTKGCGPACGCRKSGLRCTMICGNCHGQSCFNAIPVDEEIEENNDNGHEDEDITAVYDDTTFDLENGSPSSFMDDDNFEECGSHFVDENDPEDIGSPPAKKTRI